MPHAYANIAFTPAVRDVQTRMGSRENYAPFDDVPEQNNRIGPREAEFIAARDGFYQATVSETGWPYVQFRGGPVGFLKVLDEHTLGYADFRGNMQYISVGNFTDNNRVSLILMDYANRERLKILGRVRIVELDDDPALIAKLESATYRARVQRGMVIDVEAFDWNCPQHITPRFTEAEISGAASTLHAQIAELKTQLEAHAYATSEPGPRTLGDGSLVLIISEVRHLTPRVRAYVLRSVNGGALPPVVAGAHIDVPVRIASSGDAGFVNTIRRYSITTATANSYEIAVQESPHGAGGSVAVQRDYQLGTKLYCAMPGNDFRLHIDTRPALLIAGGIGITPIRAMAATLVSEGRLVQLHYAVRSNAEAAFAETLQQELGENLHLYVGNLGRRLDVSAVVTKAPDDSVVYVCGPSALIDAVRAAGSGAGFAAEDIRLERFAAETHAVSRPVHVTLGRSGKKFYVSASRSILDAVLAEGVAAPASCRAGTCGTCAVKVLAGKPDHRDYALTVEERTQGGLMCICVSRASSTELTLDM